MAGLAAILFLVGACGPTASVVVDGWSIGDGFCTGLSDGAPEGVSCAREVEARLAVAADGLDRREPGHASIVAAELHREGGYPGPDGQVLLPTRSGGCCAVAVFRLDDGSVKAIGVGRIGIDPNLSARFYGPGAVR